MAYISNLTQVKLLFGIQLNRQLIDVITSYSIHYTKLYDEFSIDSGKGNMVEISDKWFIKLAETIGFQIEKTYWETKETSQLKRILVTLEDAKEYGYTRALIGETGCGKTYVTDLFKRVNPQDVFVITVGSSDNIGDLIDKTLDAVKIPYARTKSQKLRSITAKMKELNLKGFSPMIIFDESEYMKQPALV